MSIKVGIVDDHQLFRKSISLLVNNFSGMEVVLDANDGLDLQSKIKHTFSLPDVMLIDVEMPHMNGHDTAQWLRNHHPSIRLVALSMNANEETILRMIRAGCCSYLLKDTDPEELERAINEVNAKDYFNSELTNGSLGQLLTNRGGVVVQLSQREREFLQFATSDQTYKQIALQMKMSERTIDGYRESLFVKFRVQSRTGMVIEAIRRGLVKI
ncbi:MAG: response regulator transcription factor [Bacteroidetes bacterium]|nr:response regulator transcription factor [Bacteroidota bacterium]